MFFLCISVVYVCNVFLRDLLFFLSTSVSCHGMFFPFICIVYVCNVFFFERFAFFCLHPFHVMGWSSYVFALYTFVTFFERFTGVFFNIQVLSTSVTCLRIVFLCISAVYVRYTI